MDVKRITLSILTIPALVYAAIAVDRHYVDDQELTALQARVRDERVQDLKPLQADQGRLEAEVRALRVAVVRGFGEQRLADLERERFLLEQLAAADLTPRDRERMSSISRQIESERRELAALPAIDL